jgi:hypothetical protein
MNIPFLRFPRVFGTPLLCNDCTILLIQHQRNPKRTFLSICAFFCAYKRTSENSVKAKFVECPKCEVRRIPILGTSVNNRGSERPSFTPNPRAQATGRYWLPATKF